MSASTTQVFIKSQAALSKQWRSYFSSCLCCNYAVCVLSVVFVSLHTRDMSLLAGHRRRQELLMDCRKQNMHFISWRTIIPSLMTCTIGSRGKAQKKFLLVSLGQGENWRIKPNGNWRSQWWLIKEGESIEANNKVVRRCWMENIISFSSLTSNRKFQKKQRDTSMMQKYSVDQVWCHHIYVNLNRDILQATAMLSCWPNNSLERAQAGHAKLCCN
jgi:hypothetical protein